MKFTITHADGTFKAHDQEGKEVDTDLNPNKLAARLWFRDATEVRHSYDLKLAEWKPIPRG